MNKDDLIKLAEALEGMGIEHSYSQQVLDDEDMGALFDHIKLAEQGGRPHRLRYALLGYRAAMEQQNARLDEVMEKLSAIRAGCVNLTREELIERITSVDAEEWKAGHWITNRLAPLQARVAELEALGTVYVAPDNWNYAKAGGPPSIEDYEDICLPDYGRP